MIKAQSQSKIVKRNERIRVEINKLKTKDTIQTIEETKSWFFEQINV
jgi:ribosomal protein L36